MIPITDANPTRRFPIVNLALIGINVVVFLFELTMRSRALDQFIAAWGVIPSHILFALANPLQTPPTVWLTLITSQFLHGSWAHIIGNLIFLWVFGDNIEDVLGHVLYLAFYLLSGAAAGVAQSLVMGASSIPTVGASGAIAGVLGAYLILYPSARIGIVLPIFFFFTTIDLPAVVVIGWWFVQQFFYGIGSLTATVVGGVAFWAHIGGFVAGIILILPFIGRRRQREVVSFPYEDWRQN